MRPVIDPVLEQQLQAARAQAAEPLSREEVASIVSSVLASLGGDVGQSELKVFAELEALARFIANARRELADLRPTDIPSEHIPSATDELDAVVAHTEAATNRIMDCCDRIGEIATRVPEGEAKALTDVTTDIFEACNFQDITGQRITKVVRTLRHIEAKVGAMLVAMGHDGTAELPESRGEVSDAVTESPDDMDKRLLNGPQKAGEGVDQSFIDSLFD